jgi:hypothetical protein
MHDHGQTVQHLEQARESDIAFDADTGCFRDPETAAVIPPSYHLSPDLIGWWYRHAGSDAPLIAQALATLHHSAKGYSIPALISVMGGSERLWRRVLRRLKASRWVSSTKARRGFAACWSLTPAGVDGLRRLVPKRVLAIRGPVLLALQRQMPTAHLDSLVIRAQVLTRCAWTDFHVGRSLDDPAVMAMDILTAPPAEAYAGCRDLPGESSVFRDTPSDLIGDALRGLPRQTVHRAITALLDAGLLARRYLDTTRDGFARYAVTTAGWHLLQATADSPANHAHPRRPVTETSAHLSRKRPVIVTETSVDRHGNAPPRESFLDKALDQDLDNALSIGCAAQNGGDTAGDEQQADRTGHQPTAPLPPVAVQDLRTPTPCSATPLPQPAVAPHRQTLSEAPASPMHSTAASMPQPRTQTAPTDASEWQAIVSHHHRHSLSGIIHKHSLWMAIPEHLRQGVTPDQVHAYLASTLVPA